MMRSRKILAMKGFAVALLVLLPTACGQIDVGPSPVNLADGGGGGSNSDFVPSGHPQQHQAAGGIGAASHPL
jgi:hypothetical protein